MNKKSQLLLGTIIIFGICFIYRRPVYAISGVISANFNGLQPGDIIQLSILRKVNLPLEIPIKKGKLIGARFVNGEIVYQYKKIAFDLTQKQFNRAIEGYFLQTFNKTVKRTKRFLFF